GVDLIRRIEQKTVHALTQPLVVDKVSGKKFGKSEGNAIWLDAEKTSPYDFFQFWLNVEDENVIDFLKRFTFLSLEEIGELESRLRNEPEKREAQKQLAHEVTKFVHGDKKVLSVERVAEILFEEEDLNRLQADEYEMLKLNAPYYALSNDISLIDLLTTTGLASSNREARSFIEEGAIRIAGEKYTDANNQPTFNVGDRVYVKRGKKRVMVVEFTD
ncbi:tyrosine--tRNA ligase, partial [bacterium]|nr:tyrosine--tRNA ligase [bacterium]